MACMVEGRGEGGGGGTCTWGDWGMEVERAGGRRRHEEENVKGLVTAGEGNGCIHGHELLAGVGAASM